MSPLKILQITNRVPYPLNDGGNIATYYMSKYLSQSGCELTLFCLNTKKHYQSIEPLQALAKEVYDVYVEAPISVLGAFVGLFHKMPYVAKRFFTPEAQHKLQQILAKNTFDIVQLEGVYLALYLPLIRKYAPQSKIVLRAHNIEYLIWKRLYNSEKNWLRRQYLYLISKHIQRFEQENFPLFDGIIALSEVDAALIHQAAPEVPLSVIPLGIDNEQIIEPTEHSHHHICFLGSLEWAPNEEGVLWFINEVWYKILEQIPDAQLVIAGKNPPESLRSLAIKQVEMRGEVPSAIEFVKDFDIMIVPLLSGSGIRVKIIEAFAWGKCVVSTNIGAEGLLITPDKQLLLADTAVAFAQKIVQILKDKEKRKQVALAGQQWVKDHYQWSEIIKKAIKFYNEIKCNN